MQCLILLFIAFLVSIYYSRFLGVWFGCEELTFSDLLGSSRLPKIVRFTKDDLISTSLPFFLLSTSLPPAVALYTADHQSKRGRIDWL